MIGSFDLGYGLSFSGLNWSQKTRGDTIKLDRSILSAGMGFSLSAQYRLGNSIRLGLLYQPNLLSFDQSPAFRYQHYISVNLTWKLPMNY